MSESAETAVVVGYVAKPEGEVALLRAADEAMARDTRLVVVFAHREDEDAEWLAKVEADLAAVRERLDDTGVTYELRESVTGIGAADALVDVAEEFSADLLVIGVRKRSPTGKLILGTQAQKIILDAPCPVLCVQG